MNVMQLKNIDASAVILGFTGPIGSGCTYISEMIPRVGLPKKYRYYKLSDIIRNILKSEGIKDPTVKQLQDKGNELRRTKGYEYLIGLLLSQIDSEWKQEDYGVVIDGIKNEGEVIVLRQFPYFFLFSVQAMKEVRRERVITDGRFTTPKEFDTADLRDQSEEYEYGQQVTRCSYLSDVIILNDRNIPSTAPAEREGFIREIYQRYIKLIENLHEGVKSPDVVPQVDELCMTIAYALSKASSCLKRKVDALIVDSDKAENSGSGFSGKNLSMPFVVSSGYNEVPLGSYQCVYHPDYVKCYRDYLQEVFARGMQHCPKCGTKIQIQVECPFCNKIYNEFIKSCSKCHKEIDFVFNCSKCGSNVFDLYIPGSKESPGKLLDMCRALHAEEVSLLKLAKNYGKASDNLVLTDNSTLSCPSLLSGD
jgi:deoxycytidylate deaminase